MRCEAKQTCGDLKSSEVQPSEVNAREDVVADNLEAALDLCHGAGATPRPSQPTQRDPADVARDAPSA